jgi:hypothetical protein
VGTGGAGGAQVTSSPGSNGNPSFFGNSVSGNSSDALLIAQGGAGSNGQNQRLGTTTTTPNNHPSSTIDPNTEYISRGKYQRQSDDDAAKSIALISRVITDAIVEGLAERKKEKETDTDKEKIEETVEA